MTLTFDELRRANSSRALRWHRNKPWSGSDWFTAFIGEAGEAGNIIKKLNRWRDNVQTERDQTTDILHADLAIELADAVLYLDLLADHYDIDLAAAVIDKFNLVSRREGFPERLDENGWFVSGEAHTGEGR